MYFTNFKLVVVLFSVLLFCKAQRVAELIIATEEDIFKARNGQGFEVVKVFEVFEVITPENSNQLRSARGCPQPVDGVPWIHYGNPQKCYLANHQGPCTFPSVLLRQAGSSVGICGCNCLATMQPENLFNTEEPYVSCQDRENGDKTRIFDRINEKCYTKGHPGTCQQGKVVSGYYEKTLECLPACEENEQGQLAYEQRLCEKRASPDIPPLGAIPIGIEANTDCPPGHRYSESQKKCERHLKGLVG